MLRELRNKKIALLLTLILAFTLLPTFNHVSATGQDDLIGRWERFGDGAEGTIVVVDKIDGVYQAKLEKVTGTLIELSFEINDIKWKDVVWVSGSTYTGKDMFRYEDTGAYEYRSSSMNINSNGILEVSVANDAYTDVIIGTYQTWRKLPPAMTASKPSAWAVPEIQEAIALNLTTDKVLKNYQGNITREEFCEIVVKLYEALSGQKAEPISPNPFRDTTNQEILKANKLGIVLGTSKDTFSPGNPATREQIGVMLLRALKTAKPGTAIDTTGVQVFADQNNISAYALEAVKFFNKNMIINGIGEGKIAPKGNTTREQAIAMVKRVYQKFINQ